jgi:hypothetical protein
MLEFLKGRSVAAGKHHLWLKKKKDEALQLANSTSFGLAAAVFTSDLNRY